MITSTVGTTPADSEGLSAQLIKQFSTLFSNRFDSSIRRGDLGTWRQISRFHFLTDDEIKSTIDGSSELRRAFKLDAQNHFVVIKIRHNPDDADVTARVHQRLTDTGFRPKLYPFGSEEYIYIFLSEAVDCESVTTRVTDWCKANLLDSDFAQVKVLDQADSIPFPLQDGFSALADSAKTKNDRLRSFVTAVSDGIAPELFSNLLAVIPSDFEPVQANELDVQPASIDFWDYTLAAIEEAENSSSNCTTDHDDERVSVEEATSDDNFEPNLDESRQSKLTRQRRNGLTPKLKLVTSEPTAADVTLVEKITKFSVLDNAKPSSNSKSLSKEQGLSRQVDFDQSQRPEKMSRQQQKVSAPDARSKSAPDAIAKEGPKTITRSRTSKQKNEPKQLSIILPKQRETRAPP